MILLQPSESHSRRRATGRRQQLAGHLTFHRPSLLQLAQQLFLLLLTYSYTADASALWTLTIGPYEESCFLVRTGDSKDDPNIEGTHTRKVLSGNYELLDQRLSAEPVLVYVMEGEKVVWHSKPNTPYDRFHVPMVNTARYWICLQNSSHGPMDEGEEQDHPDHEARVLGFSYRVHNRSQRMVSAVKPDDFDEERFNDWVEKAEELADDLHDFRDHFEFIKRREADHRHLVEETFDACLMWTLIEVFIVVVMAVGQVLFYRRFLEKKQKSYNYY